MIKEKFYLELGDEEELAGDYESDLVGEDEDDDEEDDNFLDEDDDEEE